MTKRELIDEITHLNPTALPGFLAAFDTSDLAEYLEHLHWRQPVAPPLRGRQQPAPTAASPAGSPGPAPAGRAGATADADGARTPSPSPRPTGRRKRRRALSGAGCA